MLKHVGHSASSCLPQVGLASQSNGHGIVDLNTSPLLACPSEVVEEILSHLPPLDLGAVLATCRALRALALVDHHWQRYVQRRVPGALVTTPTPCCSYRCLYTGLERLWFLTEHKIWFCDRGLTGKLMIARYDPRRGCIEGYQLLAINKSRAAETWTMDTGILIHEFRPELRLHLDRPILQFHAGNHGCVTRPSDKRDFNRFAEEIPMTVEYQHHGMFSNFLFAQRLESLEAAEISAPEHPRLYVWPPLAVPAQERALRVDTDRLCAGADLEGSRRCSSVSKQTFRIRHWMEMRAKLVIPGLAHEAVRPTRSSEVSRGLFSRPQSNGCFRGLQIGEEVTTYATLDPQLYSPTKFKPWRGLWVADGGDHGCEFLLVHQPDDSLASDGESDIVRQESETDDQWSRRKLDARICRGRLEGIKLTGNPNVPCGERSFVADDIGQGGCAGIITDHPFTGTRVIRSKEHVAEMGFLAGMFPLLVPNLQLSILY